VSDHNKMEVSTRVVESSLNPIFYDTLDITTVWHPDADGKIAPCPEQPPMVLHLWD